VPCPPFSIAGKRLGQEDDRDLFPQALRLIGETGPRAVLLENVKGLAPHRFDGYRAQVLERLHALGYQTWWDVVQASEHEVPQLRPRFVLVAMLDPWAGRFRWPQPSVTPPPTVGETLHDLMSARGWPGARGVEAARSRRHRRRQRAARARDPRGRAAQAVHPDGRPDPGLPGRVDVLGPQDGRLPAGRARLPAARGPGRGHRHPRRADHGSGRAAGDGPRPPRQPRRWLTRPSPAAPGLRRRWPRVGRVIPAPGATADSSSNIGQLTDVLACKLHEYFPAIAVSGTARPVGSPSPPGFGMHGAG